MDPRSAPKYRGLATLRPPAERARTFAARRRGKASRPNLEGLEDRRLLSFSPITAYAVGTDPRAVASADFNVDGRLDLVLANSDHSPNVLLGNGDGTFRPIGYTFGGVQSVAAGDFNRD